MSPSLILIEPKQHVPEKAAGMRETDSIIRSNSSIKARAHEYCAKILTPKTYVFGAHLAFSDRDRT